MYRIESEEYDIEWEYSSFREALKKLHELRDSGDYDMSEFELIKVDLCKINWENYNLEDLY